MIDYKVKPLVNDGYYKWAVHKHTPEGKQPQIIAKFRTKFCADLFAQVVTKENDYGWSH
jgi:hypothetical protein